MDEKVVVTGASMVTAAGHDMESSWNSLLAGKRGIGQIQGFDTSRLDWSTAAQVAGLNASDLDVHPRDARIMGIHSLMLLKCTRDAFDGAQLGESNIPGEEIGFFAGMGMVDYDIDDFLPAVRKSLDSRGELDYDSFYSGGYREIYPLWPLSMLNNISFCQVAIAMGMKGENAVFSPHADAGVEALIEATNTLMERRARVVLAGGVSEHVSPASLARASHAGLLTSEGDVPVSSLTPFAEDARGSVLGEGCGILTLELQSSARERKVPYSAALTGYGSGFARDGETPCPSEKAVSQAMEEALTRAGLEPEDIDLVLAHGEGTRACDAHEMAALHKTFSSCVDKLRVVPSKWFLGHLLSGAAAVDAVIAVRILQTGMVPALRDSYQLARDIPFDVLRGNARKTDPQRLMINALSSEGQCASIIMETIRS